MSRSPSKMLALYRDFYRFAGWRLWLALALMAGGALAEGVGLLLLVPLAAIALDQQSALPAWLEAPVGRLSADAGLGGAIGLFLAAMGVRSLLLYWRDTMRSRLQTAYQS